MTPGQFGPISLLLEFSTAGKTRAISSTGIPSVTAMTSSISAATASRIASAAKGGGTKIIVAFAPVTSRASATVLKTGRSAIVSPPLPGVTPPTILVPYSRQPRVWNSPTFPVMP